MNDEVPEKGSLNGKKIVLLAEYYSSGGTRTYLKQLLDFYAEAGAQIVLVGIAPVPDPQVAEWLEEYAFEYSCYWGILGKDATSSPRAKPRIWSPCFIRKERLGFRRYLRNEGADGIVVSAGTPGQFAGAAGAVLRGIYILHTYPHGRRQRLLGPWIMHTAFQRVGHLVAVSDFQKREMARLWRLQQGNRGVTVVKNSVGDPIAAKTPSNHEPWVVMTASWLEPYKEPLDWLEIALRVSEDMGPGKVHFVWFGDGSMLTSCRQALRDKLGKVNAQFIGHRDDLTDQYARADVYLQTSSTENMSLSVIEALRNGIPAVCTSVGGLPEIEIDNETGFLFPVHDSDAAAKAVVSLLTNSEMRERMASAAMLRYKTEFSYEGWATHMLQLHIEMLSHRKSDENKVEESLDSSNQ